MSRPNRAAFHTIGLSIQHTPDGGEPDAPIELPYLSDSLGTGIRGNDNRRHVGAGQFTEPGLRSFQDPSGDIAVELPSGGGPWMRLLHHALGAGEIETSGSGPYIHTFKGEKRVSGATLSVEKRVGYTRSDTLDVMYYPSVRVQQFSIHSPRDRLVRATAKLLATKEEHPETSEHVAAFDVGTPQPFNARGGQLLLKRPGEGSFSAAAISAFTIEITNEVNTDARRLTTGPYRAWLPMGGRTISGSMVAFFTPNQFDFYTSALENGTFGAELSLVRGSEILEITIPAAKLRGSPAPPVSGKRPIEVSLPFVAHRDDVTGTDISIAMSSASSSIDGIEIESDPLLLDLTDLAAVAPPFVLA